MRLNQEVTDVACWFHEPSATLSANAYVFCVGGSIVSVSGEHLVVESCSGIVLWWLLCISIALCNVVVKICEQATVEVHRIFNYLVNIVVVDLLYISWFNIQQNPTSTTSAQLSKQWSFMCYCLEKQKTAAFALSKPTFVFPVCVYPADVRDVK